MDVYDALLSERPYKAAWTPKQACAELTKQAGTQFDPQMVGTFLGLLKNVGDDAQPHLDDSVIDPLVFSSPATETLP